MSKYDNTYCFEDMGMSQRHMLTKLSQDPEQSPGASPNFIIKLNNDDELIFKFTFIIRQTGVQETTGALADTLVNGLTYVSASTAKEVETLVTREFRADPNLHKNANVQLVGDFSTGGSQSVSFEWSWKWRPPKPIEDRGGGWRNNCSVCYPPRL
jgi:Arf-GAP/SH3 domain/ANK repeat/PH domain-containing protein